MTQVAEPIPDSIAAPKPPEHNRLGLDFRAPMPRPKVKGLVIDYHTHMVAHRHLPQWLASMKHYGIDAFCSMTPLEEAVRVKRDLGDRVHFITIPKWGNESPFWVDDWLRRLESFYNLGSRIIKFHMAPGTMARANFNLEHPGIQRVIKEAVARNMILMSHVGDPDLWYQNKYTEHAKYGIRQLHYEIWEGQLREHRDRVWIGAHFGGNPENPGRLQQLLDTYPNLYLDMSATRWMVREVSIRRDAMRDFVIRNQDRLLWGSDQVSGDNRDFDFLASRLWCHRKLWETAHIGPSPIVDPDLDEYHQPILRGLALPDEVLQKIYHDNTVRVLGRYGIQFA
jgi:predicted TIM-barrel fold metal-dependent hydrolase